MPAEPPIVAAVFAWLHLLAIGVGAGMLLTEYWLCRRMPDRIQVRLLGQVDMGYQLALIGSLATGLARALYYGQDVPYYLANRLFWLKIAIFITIVAGRNRPDAAIHPLEPGGSERSDLRAAERDVERARASIALGLGLWLILPLIAILVARGYG